jgi:hypothetical protein
LPQLLQQPAEGLLAVGAADRQEGPAQRRVEIAQVAVGREDPGLAAPLALERVAVRQHRLALRGLAEVGQHDLRLDRVAADEFGQRRIAGRLVVEKDAAAGSLVERDAPAVGMVAGAAAALREAGERESDRGIRAGAHPE